MKTVVEIRIREYGRGGSITMPLCIDEQTFNDIWIALSEWLQQHDERNSRYIPVKRQQWDQQWDQSGTRNDKTSS